MTVNEFQDGANDYCEACRESGETPSLIGLAEALGLVKPGPDGPPVAWLPPQEPARHAA